MKVTKKMFYKLCAKTLKRYMKFYSQKIFKMYQNIEKVLKSYQLLDLPELEVIESLLRSHPSPPFDPIMKCYMGPFCVRTTHWLSRYLGAWWPTNHWIKMYTITLLFQVALTALQPADDARVTISLNVRSWELYMTYIWLQGVFWARVFGTGIKILTVKNPSGMRSRSSY